MLPTRLAPISLLLFIATLALLPLPAHAQNNPTSEVIITIDPEKPATPIPPDYLGLSFEMQNLLPLPDNTYLFRPDNKPLVTLFKTLGIKVIRAGGASADYSRQPPPSPADLDTFFAFAKAAACKVHYTLRYTKNPAEDAATAKYITDHYKNDLLTFEMGSEFPLHASYDQYKEAFDAFVAALKTTDCCPDISFAGPSAFLPEKVESAAIFATDYAEKGVLSFITLNAYLGGPRTNVTDPAAGRAQLLSPEFVDRYQKTLDAIQPALTAAKLQYRLGETGSYYFGGAPDVSNTHAAALWSLDYLHWWATHGAAGLNFHLGSHINDPAAANASWYAPFWSTPDGGYHAHPPAYAIKAFDLVSHGASLPLTPTNPDNANLTAYATMSSDKTIYLTLINKEIGDNAKAVRIKLAVDNYHTEQFITLTADNNDPAATDSETLGNARIADDGSFTTTWTTTTNDSPTLPPATATILLLKHN